MLYHMYEFQHTMFAPARFAADFMQQTFTSSASLLSHLPGAKEVAAACDVFELLTRRYGKPKFGLNETLIDGRPVEVTVKKATRRPFGQLLHFSRAVEGRNDPKLLVVAPLSGHYATLLRGTVEALLPDHEVYITDWRDARTIPLYEGTFDLDDYIDYVTGFLEFLGPSTHVLAVCQPSVPALAAVALMSAANHPCVPASMTLMGGPIDTRKSPTVVNDLSYQRSMAWFEQNAIHEVPWPNAGVMRKVYPGFLQLSAFMNMNLEDHMGAHRKMFDHLVLGDEESVEKHRLFYEEYLAVMDLPAEFYLQTVKTVFKDHALPKGEMTSRGRPVDCSAITRTALMTVEGELDDISGVGQTRAAHDLCTGVPGTMKNHYEQKGVGHYGIFNGRKWKNKIAPRIKEFILTHHQD